MRLFSATLIILGALAVLYTVVANLIGLPEIADCLPVNFWGELSGQKAWFYKVEALGDDSSSGIYTIFAGLMLVIVGFLIRYLSRTRE